MLAAVLLCVTPCFAQAQEGGADEALVADVDRAAVQARMRRGDIDIDGRIDEAAWADAAQVSGFIQSEPVEGGPAEADTEVRVLFDEDAMYVAARMHDPDPDGIVRQLVRRDDQGTFDWFTVSLDPNRDGLTGYTFQVSAAGVQRDQYLFGDRQEDAAWDAVWASGVEVDAQGWTAEIRIPLSQIRYESSDDPQTWGINFARRRVATNELSYFELQSRLREGRVSQFGVMENVEVTSPSRRIELRPYVLSSVHDGPSLEGDPFFDGSAEAVRIGGDFRIGLGSAFTLDATVNPDFGQVEADPAEINLSAFETRFDERRPFFVEDAQVFDFDLGGRENQLFYSRRIGRAPQGFSPSAADFIDEPAATTILGSAKLTGRTVGGLSIGALAAVTDSEVGRAYFVDEDLFEEFAVEPRTEYGVVRLQQDLRDGATTFGGIVTALHRELPGDGTFDFLPGQAYSGGLRFDHEWGDREWSLSGFFAGTHVRGDSKSMIRVQRSSNHYFQRPDATRLSVDSTATSLSGAQWRLSFSRQNGQHWTGSVWLGEITSGFEVNDIGFSRSSEKLDIGARIGYREIRPGNLFRNYNVTMFSFHNFSHEALDDPGRIRSWSDAYIVGSHSLNTRFTFLNYWGGDVNISYSPDRVNFSATRGGPVMGDPGSVNVRGGLNTDQRKSIHYRLGGSYRQGFAGSGNEYTVSATVSMRPTSQLEIEVQPRFSAETNAAQYVTSTSTLPWAPTFGRRYLFADLSRRSVSMETRASWTFSPTLSFQLFAQPLLSSGDYLSYKQFAAPRTYDFLEFEEGTYVEAAGADRCGTGAGRSICENEGRQYVDFDGDGLVDYNFTDQDFNSRSLVGNAVLRWEYRPGSTVFLVWQRDQRLRAPVGDFDFSRDLDALLGAPANNRFILKVNYWLGL